MKHSFKKMFKSKWRDLQNPDVVQINLLIIVSLFEALHVAVEQKNVNVLILIKSKLVSPLSH